MFKTRSSGRSAPLLLAPAEGWGALQAPMALRAVLGAFGLSSIVEGALIVHYDFTTNCKKIKYFMELQVPY